jgi:hypothetical protein
MQRYGEEERRVDGIGGKEDPRAALSPRQFKALRLAVRKTPIDVIADQVGVSPHLAKRWLETPRFRRAVLAELERPLSSQEFVRVLLLGPKAALASERSEDHHARGERG